MANQGKAVEDLPTAEEKLETIRQNVAEKETTPTQPSKSYEMFKQYFEATEKSESQETVVIEAPAEDNTIYASHILCGVLGFAMGALIVYISFKFKIRRIRAECNAKISEARATVDRMISVMAKE